MDGLSYDWESPYKIGEILSRRAEHGKLLIDGLLARVMTSHIWRYKTVAFLAGGEVGVGRTILGVRPE